MRELKLWAANIRGAKATWSFDTSSASEDAVILVRNWAKLPTAPGLLLYGRAGLGKTGLAVSALREIIGAGFGEQGRWDYVTLSKVVQAVEVHGDRQPLAPVWFDWWPGLVRRFGEAARGNGEEAESYGQLQQEFERHVRIAALDDFDIASATPFREELMVWFLDEFTDYGRNLIVTINKRSPEELMEFIGERATDRLFSKRFLQVRMDGGSLR